MTMIMISKDKLERINEMLGAYYGAMDNILYKHGSSAEDQKECEVMVDDIATMIHCGGDLFEIQESLNLRWRDNCEDEIKESDLKRIATEANSLLLERGIRHVCSARLDAGRLILELDKD